MKKDNEKIDGLFRDYFKSKHRIPPAAKKMRSNFIEEQDICCNKLEIIPHEKPFIPCPPDEDLSAYIAGNLEDGLTKEHISTCAECRGKVKAAKEAIIACESTPDPIPEDLDIDLNEIKSRQKDHE